MLLFTFYLKDAKDSNFQNTLGLLARDPHLTVYNRTKNNFNFFNPSLTFKPLISYLIKETLRTIIK